MERDIYADPTVSDLAIRISVMVGTDSSDPELKAYKTTDDIAHRLDRPVDEVAAAYREWQAWRKG